jgi:2-polyprenyl-3-methyl-5-hydroxy-6-metoxy-1,4-benzoquinol methylase
MGAPLSTAASRPLDYDSAQKPSDYDVLFPAVSFLLPRPRWGMRLLDVGCGNGFWAQQFAELGYTVVGIDPSESGIRLARQTVPAARFEVLSAAENLCEQLGERPFDVVVSLEVIEHLYSPLAWARGCYAALKPDGILICSTPHHGYFKNLAISLAGGWDRHFSPTWEGGHIKFWSRKTLTRLLIGAGFRREKLRFRGAGRVPLLWKSIVARATK